MVSFFCRDLNAAIESALPTSIVFQSNDGSIWLSFRDMIRRQRMTDGKIYLNIFVSLVIQ